MLRRRDLQQRLLSAAWQVAAAEQQRGAHRAAGRSGGGGPQASGGRHTSSSMSTASGDHDAAKRERRRQRRARNRELRERVCLNSAGVDFAASWQGQHHGGRQGQRTASTPWTCQQQDSSSSESESDWDDWEVLEAVLGRPRTAAERRKFGRVWREWQRASAAARGGTANGASGSASASSSSSSSSGGSSSGWAGMCSDDEEGWSGASSSGASSYSAGNSAGPRWGKASWTWEDMHSEYGSRSGSASADYETWYTPPPGGGSSGRRRAAAGGSHSTGDAWGSHASWQWSAGGGWHTGSWQSSSWQHEGWHGSSSSSSSTSGSNTASGGMAGHLRLLGLESSWLSTRCGKALRCAFLAKAKAEHPDMHAAAGSGAAAAAKERFQRVTEAYEALLAMVRP